MSEYAVDQLIILMLNELSHYKCSMEEKNQIGHNHLEYKWNINPNCKFLYANSAKDKTKQNL